MDLDEIMSQKLTNDKTAEVVEENYRGLLAAGCERDPRQEKTIKLNKLERKNTPEPVYPGEKEKITDPKGNTGYTREYYCPDCFEWLGQSTHSSTRRLGYYTVLKGPKLPAFCPFCGQALDWSKSVEETCCFTCEQCDNFSTNGTLASCESNDVSAEDFYESRLKRRACKNFVHRTRGVE